MINSEKNYGIGVKVAKRGILIRKSLEDKLKLDSEKSKKIRESVKNSSKLIKKK